MSSRRHRADVAEFCRGDDLVVDIFPAGTSLNGAAAHGPEAANTNLTGEAISRCHRGTNTFAVPPQGHVRGSPARFWSPSMGSCPPHERRFRYRL